ncbi:MAG: flagellar export protein FliJ [Spirochaetes bacterium GWF1_51_8]|nr:MAG: flagellar export protein FliJ [Spirochaetes bacterium GWF1_51_8]
MKRFSFRLQRLLDIRKDREEEAKIELAKASGAYQLEVNKKLGMFETLRELRSSLSARGNLTLAELQEYDRLSQDTDLAVLVLDKEIEAKKLIMEEKLVIYTKLKQERRAVEILKEKALEKYREEEKREEQQVLDEMGQNIHRKNQADRKNSENQNEGFSEV